MTAADVRIARLAERQHGVFSRAQALELGVSSDSIDRRLSSKAWVRLHPGVYRVGGAPGSFEGRALAAVFAAGPNAFASHVTAGALFGLDGCTASDHPHVSLLDRRRIEISGVCVHTPRTLRRGHTARVGVVPVTNASRTIVDLAGSITKANLELALDDAIRRGLVNADRMFRAMRSRPVFGRRGASRLVRLLQDRREGGTTESALETHFARLLRRAGLPDPTRQHEIRDREGVFVARVDFAYPSALIAIEIDGYAHHSGRGRFEHDRRRQNRIVELGWTPLRFASGAINEHAAEVAETVARALDATGLVRPRRDRRG